MVSPPRRNPDVGDLPVVEMASPAEEVGWTYTVHPPGDAIGGAWLRDEMKAMSSSGSWCVGIVLNRPVTFLFTAANTWRTHVTA